VYVNLELTPYIARTDPAQEIVLHTGEALSDVDGAWLTDSGRLLLRLGDKVAAIDDRDMADALQRLAVSSGRAMADDEILAWLSEPGSRQITFRFRDALIPVARIADTDIASFFGFVPAPRP
jgi:hypothetical protein